MMNSLLYFNNLSRINIAAPWIMASKKNKTIREQKDVSIEYAHIYTNKNIDEEQKLSLHILKKLQEELLKNKKSFLLTVLVDDYSFPDPSFDYGSFTWWLGKQGFPPDFVLRESQLIPLCDEVINYISDEKMKDQMINYVKVKKYPCSLFIAAWYLLRLGYLTHPILDKKYITSRLINILPESFKPYEDKALEIIVATSFADAKQYIEYQYIPGREIHKDESQKQQHVPASLQKQIETIVNNFTVKPIETIEHVMNHKKVTSYEQKRKNAKLIDKLLEKETEEMKLTIFTEMKQQSKEKQNAILSLLDTLDEGDEGALAEYGLLFKYVWLKDVLEAIISEKHSIAVHTIEIPLKPQQNLLLQSSINPWGLQPANVDSVSIALTKLLRRIDENKTIRIVIAINDFFNYTEQRPLSENERDNLVISTLNFLEFHQVLFSDDLAGLDFYVNRESQQIEMVDELIHRLRKSQYGKIILEEDGSLYFKPASEYLVVLSTLSKVTQKEIARFGILIKDAQGIPSSFALGAATYLNPIYTYFMHFYILDKKEKATQEKIYTLLHAINVIRGERSHEIYYDSGTIFPNVILYCISKMMQRAVKQLLMSYDAYDDWSAFDPYEYAMRNFGNNGEILPEDKRLIMHAIQALQQVGISQKSLKDVADIGSGPNLYPAMILVPFLHTKSVLHLLEFSENRSYLQKLVDGTMEREHAKIWHKFEEFMVDVGGDMYQDCEESAKKKIVSQFGDIFSLPKNKYDLLTSYFVSESIVDSQMQFREAIQSMGKAIKRDGIMMVAHMVGSEGWHAGKGSKFPAINLTAEQIKQAYLDADLDIISTIVVGHDTQKVREGYTGMMLVIAQRY